MRRQTALDGAPTAGIGTTKAPDPGSLPQTFEAALAAHPAAKWPQAKAIVHIGKGQTTIEKQMAGSDAVVTADNRDFEGVAAEVTPCPNTGAILARLILVHPDPSLSVVLKETTRPEDLAGDWQAWAVKLTLPMVVLDADGELKPIRAFRAQPSGHPEPRRRNASLTGRRPRFLVRRKVGQVTETAPVHRGEHEIIARD